MPLMPVAARFPQLLLRRAPTLHLNKPTLVLTVRHRLVSTAQETGAASAARSTASLATASAKSAATSTANSAATKAGPVMGNASVADSAASAAQYASKATEGLSRVSAAATPAIVNAAKTISSAMGRAGGPTAKLASAIERYLLLVIYYGKVGKELSKIVFQGRNMTPPPFSVFQAIFQNLWRQYLQPNVIMSRLREGIALARTQMASLKQARTQSGSASGFVMSLIPQLIPAGVVVAECLGFFTVGEIVGRLKLVGYRGQTDAYH